MCHYSHLYREFLDFDPPDEPVSVSEKIIEWRKYPCKYGPGIIEIVTYQEKDEISNKIHEKRDYITQGHIQNIINDFLSFIDPQIVRTLPKLVLIVEESLSDDESNYKLGEYEPLIEGKSVLIKLSCHGFFLKYANPILLFRETIFHELSHWLFENSVPTKKKRIIEYFLQRISVGSNIEELKRKLIEQSCDPRKTELRERYFGFSDNFGINLDLDDSAGRIYKNDFDAPDRWGREFVPEHLSKLALTPNKFMHYFNSMSGNGVYCWREAFNICKSLFVI